MTTRNDVTGDKIKSKPNSDAYRTNHDKIFGKRRADHLKTEREAKEVQRQAEKLNEYLKQSTRNNP